MKRTEHPEHLKCIEILEYYNYVPTEKLLISDGTNHRYYGNLLVSPYETSWGEVILYNVDMNELHSIIAEKELKETIKRVNKELESFWNFPKVCNSTSKPS